MEPDIPDVNVSSLLDESSAQITSSYGTTGTNPNLISNFNDAVAALQRHTFKNVTDFQGAVREARRLQKNTARTINSADISNLLAARDQLHSYEDYLAYVSILHASLIAVEVDSPLIASLMNDVRSLIASTPQEWVRAIPVRWVGICRHASKLAIETNNILLAISLIEPLEQASKKLSPTPGTFNPIQADFLALHIGAKCYKRAAIWLKKTHLHHIDVVATGIGATDVHLFYHYATMIFIGLKKYKTAIQYCRIALSVPAPAPGAFFEASAQSFKLYVLLCLLVHARPPENIKYCSYQTSRLRKSASKYMELVSAYDEKDLRKVQQVFETNRESFDQDGNLGLVKQVVQELSKLMIVRLTNSFVTMKVSDVARRTGLPSETAAHAILVDMIRNNQINASIDERTGVVRLMDNDEVEENAIVRNLSRAYMSDCVDTLQRVEAFRDVLVGALNPGASDCTYPKTSGNTLMHTLGRRDFDLFR